MKVHWSLWVALVVLVLTIVILSARREGYAPPRDENTQPPYTNDISNTVTLSNNLPYVDSTSNVVLVDNQTQIYKDMGGMDYQIQAGNPILNFIQGDPSSNVMYGDFVAHQSDGGSARMYAFHDLEMIAEGDTVSNTSNIVAVDENPTMTKSAYSGYGVDVNGNIINPDETQITITSNANAIANLRYGFDEKGNATTNPNDNAQVYGFNAAGDLTGVDIKGSPIMPDAGQYIPMLTSPTIPFLGNQPGISA
jgi:hypothetical protein